MGSTSNEQLAFDRAIEFAKIICANPSNKIYLNEESAVDLATFIHALAGGLLEKEN